MYINASYYNQSARYYLIYYDSSSSFFYVSAGMNGRSGFSMFDTNCNLQRYIIFFCFFIINLTHLHQIAELVRGCNEWKKYKKDKKYKNTIFV